MEVNRLIVFGASAGGMSLIFRLIEKLPANFSIPMVCALHVTEDSNNTYVQLLNNRTRLTVKEAEEKEVICGKTIYLAPAGYHLLIEPDWTFTLTHDEYVKYARPSIDVLFESAAYSLGKHIIGFLGTGGNSDGAIGLMKIKERGGFVMVQKPAFSEFTAMPEAALALFRPHRVVSPDGLIEQLIGFNEIYLKAYEQNV